MTKRFDDQLEDMYYVDHVDIAGWITLETHDGTEIDIDFDFESDFKPQFMDWFEANPSSALYARFRAADLHCTYMSDRILLNRQ